MAVNIKRIMEHLGYSEKEIAEQLDVDVSYLRALELDEKKLSQDMIHKFADLLEVSTKYFMDNFIISDQSSSKTGDGLHPNDEWKKVNAGKKGLYEYVEEGSRAFPDDPVSIEVERVQNCCKSFKKPKVSFAGQSDSGKSTLINALIGAEHMPAKWTPTTSIIVYLKHIDDKPNYIKEDVWIFKRLGTRVWQDSMLTDEKATRQFLLMAGGYEILETYGTHQKESSQTKEAVSAVAFIDSPLLKDCDILDIPGFAATAEDDALHKFVSQDSETDVLIYLSRANGFLQEGDINYLNKCINALNPLERSGKNGIVKLENLFIVASQSGAVNQGNAAELNGILELRCAELIKHMKVSADVTGFRSLLPLRTKQTGYNYEPADIHARFFTYEKDLPRLCAKFNKAFSSLVEKIPLAYQIDFCERITALKADSSVTLRNKIDEFLAIIAERDKYLELLRDIEDSEPQRKIEQGAKNSKMRALIQDLASTTKTDIESFYYELLTEDHLVQMIENHGYKNKKSDKTDFASLVNKVLSDKIQLILTQKTEEYSEEMDSYLQKYEQSFQSYSSKNKVKMEFSANKSFALGLTGLAAIGASGAWLATSFTAWSVGVLGAYAGLGPILAVGGVIGIGIAGVIAGIIAIVTAFTWKKDLAKKIIKAYDSERFLDKVSKETNQYWDDTLKSFNVAAEQVETEWEKYIQSIRELADEASLPALKQKLNYTKQGLSFFENMPLPKMLGAVD